MTELIRPCLYEAYHDIVVVESGQKGSGNDRLSDIVGPVCETSDFLAVNRLLPDLQQGALLAIQSCGAYGSSMGSTYNTRPRPPEILIEENSRFRMIRRREQIEEIWQNELNVPPG